MGDELDLVPTQTSTAPSPNRVSVFPPTTTGTYEREKRLPGKPQLPPQSDRPLMGIHSEKNFITANVAEAIMAVAKRPLHACVDQRRGDKFLMDGSGLVQRFLKKKVGSLVGWRAGRGRGRLGGSGSLKWGGGEGGFRRKTSPPSPCLPPSPSSLAFSQLNVQELFFPHWFKV